MTSRVPEAVHQMNPETIEHLQELVRGLIDSAQYHREAAEKIDDENVATTFRKIAQEREQICNNLSSMVALTDEEPADEGTWSGSLRKTWTAMRANLNSGDPRTVLIEAERAEDVIVHKFEEILPSIAGNPVNDKLMEYYEAVKRGHDQVLALRNAYQNKTD